MSDARPRIGLAHIAQRTRLSAQTVCHILNPQRRGRYAPATVERVLRAADSLGYRPNRAAQALVTGRTHLIGLWLWQFRSAYYAWVLDELIRQMQSSRYEPMIGYAAGNLHPMLDSIRGAGWHMDGTIAIDVATSMSRDAALSELRQVARTRPFVSIGNFWIDSADYVGFDLGPVVVEAIRHLVKDGGCRSIAYLALEGSAMPGEVRFDAYHQAMQDAGKQPLVLKLPHLPRPALREWLRDAFSERSNIDGIFLHDDTLALPVTRALQDLGRRIPEDVALVSCGGLEEMDLAPTPASTIAQPVPEMCRLAWQFLQNRINQPDCDQQTAMLRPTLVVRASSDRNQKTYLPGAEK